MKRLISILMVLSIVLPLVACGGSEPVLYENSEDFENALNDDVDTVGSSVIITADEIVADTIYGWNIQTGEHLNFCSEDDPGVSTGDVLKVEVTKVKTLLMSYIIEYNLLEVVKTSSAPVEEEQEIAEETELTEEVSEEVSEVETEDTKEDIKKEETEQITTVFDPTQQTDDLAAMFMYIGFTEEEAAEMEEIFDTLGIHEGRNIRLMPYGDGIDGLQAFAFDPYDSKNLQINCTVENRDLCLVWLAGIPGYKPVFKIGFFGRPKIVEEMTKESVDMFNRWVDDTTYHQPIEDSYLVTIDWDEMKLSEYKEGTLG